MVDPTTETHQLKLAVNELRILNDIATTISSIQPVEEIIDQIVLKCITHLQVEEGTISLLEQNASANQFHTMIRHQDSSATRVPIKLDDRLTGWMLKNQSILLSNNIRTDKRFSFLDEPSYSFKSLLCVPLMVKGKLIGYLAVFNKKNGEPFTKEDRRLLSIIGSQSAQVIEAARLYEEEKALISLQEELRLSREIQLNLLPKSTPDIQGFQIAATNIPAKSVGGDYYDFVSIAENRLGFCIGDITGKGMPAALLMANLQATFRSHALLANNCANCLKGTNKLLYKSTEPTKFATLFYGILDINTGLLEFANGGHDAPLLFREGSEPKPLEATGLLLGVVEDTDYTQSNISFQKGDILFSYTDGITEAMNTQGEELGLAPIIQIINEYRHQPAEAIMSTILNRVKAHARQASQSDDITLIILKYTA